MKSKMTTPLALGVAFWMPSICLHAQQKEGPILLTFTVTDTAGRSIKSLEPKDLRILEDNVVQKISSFAEGKNQPVEVLQDGTVRSLSVETWQKQIQDLGSTSEDSYALVYYPQPNSNQGFRKVRIEITSDAGKKYRIRSSPGYRPRQ